jgi:hypothetical protein
MVELTRYGSYLVGNMPGGCVQCTRGEKLVLFVTGLCSRACYYCPLSPERRGRDVTFANERPVNADSDIIEEARLMDARGTGMTGGDPLHVPQRSIEYLSLLKSEFGDDHHVHLYTAMDRIETAVLKKLHSGGLDELRFHARRSHQAVIRRAGEIGLNVGVEIPSLPDRLEEMKAIALMADRCGCGFMNINELEMCATTADAFRERGLRLVDDESMAVEGSLEVAVKVAEFCENETSLNVHVCPSSLKDRFQLRNRLGRIAENVRRPYEMIDEDNLLVRATITQRSGRSDLSEVARRLRNELHLSEEMIVHDHGEESIEAPAWAAKEIVELVDPDDLEVALVEEYPSWDRLRTERRTLN